MNRFFKRIFPVLLAAVIIASIGWYLFEYDTSFTRDILLKTARNLESNGNLSAAIWLYNLTYNHTGGSDEVAIELAEQFKSIGNFSKAEYTLRKAIEDGGSVELYIALCKTYVEQGKLRDAVLMLENVGGEMKEKLEELRPKAPQASYPSGSYRQYLSVDLTSEGHTIYFSCDNDYPSGKSDAYTGPVLLTGGETTIFSVSVADNGLVSPLAVYNYIIHDVVEAVDFTDPGFDAAVRQHLQYGDDRVIYSNNLWAITELTLTESVASCADLKWLPNLQHLSIHGGKLNDFEAITGCHSLTSLKIIGSTVSTEAMQTIGSLGSLTSLTLKECSISSIVPLAPLTGLTSLDLSSNAIRDITTLATFTNLTSLNLSSNALISLTGLENLSALKTLDVSFNSIVSTAPLAAMTALTELDVSSNALRSLDTIGNLVLLEKLCAAYNELLDLDALANCKALVYLDVSHNTLLNINAATSLRALEELNFSHNEVSQLPQFPADSPLRVINGEYNQISSLKKLGGLPNLTHVYMNYNEQISSVQPLASCKALKEVYVYGTKVRSVSVLTKNGVLVVYSPV